MTWSHHWPWVGLNVASKKQQLVDHLFLTRDTLSLVLKMDVETVSRQILCVNSVLLCTRVETSLALTVVQNMVDRGLRVGPYIPSKQEQLVDHLLLTRGTLSLVRGKIDFHDERGKTTLETPLVVTRACKPLCLIRTGVETCLNVAFFRNMDERGIRVVFQCEFLIAFVGYVIECVIKKSMGPS